MSKQPHPHVTRVVGRPGTALDVYPAPSHYPNTPSLGRTELIHSVTTGRISRPFNRILDLNTSSWGRNKTPLKLNWAEATQAKTT